MECLYDLCFPGLGVDFNDLAPGDVVKVDLVAMPVFCTMGRVVVQADDFLGAILVSSLKPGVVLESKLDFIAHFETRRLSRELPYDLAGLAIDLVYCVCVASGDQIIALVILVYRVDVEIVPGIGAVITSTGLTRIKWQISLCPY